MLSPDEVSQRLGKKWHSFATDIPIKETVHHEPSIEKLGIFKLSDAAGYGIKNLVELHADEFISHYGGERLERNSRDYDHRYTLLDYQKHLENTAHEYINFGALLTHLPDYNTLEALGYDSKSTPITEVASANVRYGLVMLDNYDYQMSLFAMRNIPANSLLGFDYSDHYWGALEESPFVFDKRGKTINDALYSDPKLFTVTADLGSGQSSFEVSDKEDKLAYLRKKEFTLPSPSMYVFEYTEVNADD